jgi:hypothetical protein
MIDRTRIEEWFEIRTEDHSGADGWDQCAPHCNQDKNISKIILFLGKYSNIYCRQHSVDM